MEIYLDNSATTKPYPKVCESMVRAMEEDYYNPSSIYRDGVLVQKKIERYREYIANTLKCSSKEILFTSGGTESINTAIFSVEKIKKKAYYNLDDRTSCYFASNEENGRIRL